MGFLTGTNILMMRPSPELSILIPANCIYCYEKLNLTDRKAMIIGPCQHIFCQRCVNLKIFKDKEVSDCSECFKQVNQSFAQPSRFFEKIYQTFQQLSKQQLEQDKVQDMERKIALKFKNDKDYECLKCGNFFDSQKRRPVNLCKNQHIICEVCLKSDEKEFKKCKQCGEKTDSQSFYFNQSVMRVCDFITKTLFTTKVYFSYGEQALSVTIDESLSIKDIFHGLQEYNLMPKNLEIKHCKFTAKAKRGSQTMKIEVKMDRKIDSIKGQMGIQNQTLTISMECDEEAKSMGGEVTMCSKVISDLAIKINSFQPQQKFSFIKSSLGKEDFGEEFKVEKSQIYPTFKKQIKKNQLSQPPKNQYPNSQSKASRTSSKQNERGNEGRFNYKEQSHGKLNNSYHSSKNQSKTSQVGKQAIQKQFSSKYKASSTSKANQKMLVLQQMNSKYSNRNPQFKIPSNVRGSQRGEKQPSKYNYPNIQYTIPSNVKGYQEEEKQHSKYNYPNLQSQIISNVKGYQEEKKQLLEQTPYPSKIPSKVIEYNKEEIQQKQNPIKSRLKLYQESQVRSKVINEEQQEILFRKKSKIGKRFEKQIGTKIDDERMYTLATNAPQNKRDQIWKNFLIHHEVKDQDEALICFMCEKIMNKQFTKGELSTSKALEKQIDEQAEAGAKSATPSRAALLSMILKILKAELNDGKIEVIFTPKSTDRSKLSLKTITSHFLSDRVILKQTVDEDPEWYFQRLYDSDEDLKMFVTKQRKRISQSFGVSENSLVFHDIIKGSNILVMSTNQSSNIVNHLKVNLNKKIQLHPYFTRLQLSPDDFDERGCIDFPINGNYKDRRGSLPYYQPISSSRYGIKVSKIFDKGNDRWLAMKNLPGEWAVGFHGVKHPNATFKSYKNVVESLLSGLRRSQNQNLIVVQNIKQLHCDDDCINKEGQKIGKGVYLTPFFAQALPFTTVIEIGQKQYNLVFQCRLNPQNIKFSAENQNVWVVNRSADIRPYGIVLIEHKKGYPSPLVQFGENFDYNKYKHQILKKPVLFGSQVKNSKKISNISSSSK